VKNVDHSIAQELPKLASLDFQQRHNEKSHPDHHIPATIRIFPTDIGSIVGVIVRYYLH
jgi:hypothetical protein